MEFVNNFVHKCHTVTLQGSEEKQSVNGKAIQTLAHVIADEAVQQI